MKDLQERLNASAEKKLDKFIEDVFLPLATQEIKKR